MLRVVRGNRRTENSDNFSFKIIAFSSHYFKDALADLYVSESSKIL